MGIIFAGSHDEKQAAISVAFASLRHRFHNRVGPGDRRGDPLDRQPEFHLIKNKRCTGYIPGGMALRFVVSQELQRHMDQR